ncbi:DNA polymerase III subunit chi [Paracoccus suum]|uniref:DNA polymerase III subunit chi n=1 Tax=Paracoccus suum TaxID=2259340 RepID=A0A344PGG8_9RHOB|nr:DNA polymerase III subunit chi [Paracoccus suum]AXC48473.1 DNA polymerase III subunit chi [Paracoccus suum]
MGAALFYQLTRQPAEDLVPILIDKALAQGWRVELRGTAEARLARFDDLLWAGDGFVPHARAGGPHDARQPVLLTLASGASEMATSPGPAANAPDCIVTLDGAEVSADECGRLARVCILFDGSDSAALGRARSQWRGLTAAGVTAEYWSDESGGWRRQARSGER